jgi:hypothetical protein
MTPFTSALPHAAQEDGKAQVVGRAQATGHRAKPGATADGQRATVEGSDRDAECLWIEAFRTEAQSRRE